MAAIAPVSSCPKCKALLRADSWFGDDAGKCQKCLTSFDYIPFPAGRADVTVAVAHAAIPEDSVCFFHSQSKAEVVCEGCGRFLCPVCAVPFAGKRLCAPCIATETATQVSFVKSRVRYDNIALSLCVLPLVTVFLVFFSILTAPVALGFVIAGWRRPGSLVGRSKAKFIAAGIISSLTIVGWIVFFIYIHYFARNTTGYHPPHHV